MAANDEFPRGLVLQAANIANLPATFLTFPGFSGIAWVLSHVQIKAQSNAAAGGSWAIIAAQSGALRGPTMQLGMSATNEWDSDSWDGEWEGLPGDSLDIITAQISQTFGIYTVTAVAYPI